MTEGVLADHAGRLAPAAPLGAGVLGAFALGQLLAAGLVHVGATALGLDWA